jgi:hypothetical protein
MITSRYVIKSSGKELPKLSLNFLKIVARLLGEICLAASIRNPEKPIERSSVK